MPSLSEEETAKALASAIQAPAAGPLAVAPNSKGVAGGMREFYFFVVGVSFFFLYVTQRLSGRLTM